MRYKKIMMLTIIISCLLAISVVSAAENATCGTVSINDASNDVVSVEDNNQVTGQTENEELSNGTDDGTFTALQNKINAADSCSIITFENDYEYDEGFSADGILITKDLTIDGNGHTINAQQKARIFLVQAENVIIKNLNIENSNYTQNGGGICFCNLGTVENCNFTNNKVASHGSAVYFGNTGNVTNCNFDNNTNYIDMGAIYFSHYDSTSTVTNCNFTDNHGCAISFNGAGIVENCNFNNNSGNYSGAVYFFRDGEVTNCNFEDNTASNGWGGAIRFIRNGAVTNCNFTDNQASMNGGAICFYGAGIVEDCNFADNKAFSNGGAINFDIEGTVKKCNFTDNKATSGSGGAVYFNIPEHGCNVRNSSFLNNNAIIGGAMYQGFAIDCSFINNHADSDGGAIFNSSVINSLFEYNSATNGGALYGKKATNCTFNENTAETGGAAYNAKISTNSKFNNNNATNGKDTYEVTWFDMENQHPFHDLNLLINNNTETEIYLNHNYTYDSLMDYDYHEGIVINRAVTIHGNGFTIDGNHEAQIFSVNNNVTFRDIVFVNGNTTRNGGAITGPATAINCSFINNNANYGGALKGGSVVNCTFINNHANNGGAMIYGSALNCTFTNNAADIGGAIYDSSAENCTFINNYARFSGGAMDCGYALNCTFINNHAYLGGAMDCGSALNCTFTNNAAGDGGAMYGGSALNCAFINNHATHGGGAVYNSPVINSLFEYNSATNGGALYGKKAVNCTFNENTAETGGAAYNAKISTNSKFNNNNATNGKDTYEVTWFDMENQHPFRDLNLLINNSTETEIYLNHNYTYDFFVDSEYIEGIVINRAVTIHGNGFTIDGDHEARIFSVNNNVTFRDIVFVNGATSKGGAINGNAIAVNCSFVGNFAYYGGAMYEGSAINCIFISNEAEYGGAMYDGSALNCTFIKNYAFYSPYIYDSGGAMYGGSAVNCSFNGNGARNGGAMYDGSAVNCTFINNFASPNPSVTNPNQGYGGAMYHGFAYNCYFMGNSALWGDDTYETSFYNSRFGDAVIFSSDVTKYYGDSKNCIIYLTDNNGALTHADVEITINNETFTAKTDSNGQISVDLNLSVGEYNLTAVYENVSTASKVIVKSTVAAEDAYGTYLNSKVSASFLNTDGTALSGKQVTFKVGDKTFNATTDADGAATAYVDLGVGNYTITTVNPANGEEKQFKLVINKVNPAINLTSVRNNGVTTLTATLTPEGIVGNVVFSVNGDDKFVAINGSKAILTVSDLDSGSYTATASYNGDENSNASTSNTVTFTVVAGPILTANPVTKTYGTSTKLIIYLKDNNGNKVANEYVNVAIGSDVKTVKTNADGKATMDINKAPGTYTATITYADAKTTAKIKVKKATPKLTAKAKTFKKSVKTKKYTVTLKTNQNKVMKNTKVTITVNKKTYSAKTNSKGVATFKLTKLTKKGKYPAVVKYSGSKYYSAKTVKPKITLK